MPRDFKDLIVDEADHKVRYNLVDRNGAVLVEDVRIVVASPVLQEGDTFGARELNAFLEIQDDGSLRMKIDGGTY